MFLLSHPYEDLRKPGIDRFNAAMNEIAESFDQARNLVKGGDRDLRHRAYLARQVFDDLKDLPNEFHEALA